MSIDLEKIIKADLAHLIHPLYHLSDAKSPFVWVKGEGSTLWAADGRESNDSAIKTVRFFWINQGKPEKTKIISREYAYHGVTIGAMNATGLASYWPMFGGKLAGYIHIPSPYPYRYVSQDASVTQG